MYKLIIQDDEGKTTVVPLIREELTIGRQEGNTIRLTERNVSRRHAKLLRGQDAIIIEDLDSYNGVRVNGSRIQGKAEIKEADRVQIGDYLIEVKAEQALAAAAAETGNFETLKPGGSAAPVPVASSGSDAVTAPAQAPTAAAVGSDNFGTEAEAAVTQSTAPVPAADECGRLVILSTGMAGQEYQLDKPAMVIGRTDENDICVNHRSISRHHAKVVRENGTYSVVDLHSANGVRVNGEEYGKVELRPGDLVDLGHVRFRYVAPGEDFLFGRDAQAVDIATEGKGGGKGIWIALVLILAGVAAFLALSGGDDDKSPDGEEKPAQQATGTEDPKPPDTDPVLETAIDASMGTDTTDPTTDPDSDDSAQFAAHIEAAIAARGENDWKTMASEAKKALAIDSSSEKAQELAQQAEFEAANKGAFDLFQAAVGKRKWAQVAGHYAKIDDASVYKVQAQPDHDRLKNEYSDAQVEMAKKAAAKHKCSEISRAASKVPSQWPDVAQRISGVDCTRVASNDTNNTTNNNNNNNTPPDVKPPDPPKNDGPPFDELMEQASAAVRDRHYGKGLKLCEQALEERPNDQQAAMVCGIAACNLKKSAAAKKYLRRIRGASKKASLRQICVREGVPGFVD